MTELQAPFDDMPPSESDSVDPTLGAEREFTVQQRSQWKTIARRFTHHKPAMISVVVFILLMIFAFVGPMLWKYKFAQVLKKPPGANLACSRRINASAKMRLVGPTASVFQDPARSRADSVPSRGSHPAAPHLDHRCSRQDTALRPSARSGSHHCVRDNPGLRTSRFEWKQDGVRSGWNLASWRCEWPDQSLLPADPLDDH